MLARGDRGHRFPHFLPDGRTFLFAIGGQAGAASTPARRAAAASTPPRWINKIVKRVLSDGAYSVYVEPGFLMFVRQQTLMAIPFDNKTLEVSGTPQPVAERVRGGLFSVASNGTIVYRSGGDATVQLSWFMRDGRRLGDGRHARAVSPDGAVAERTPCRAAAGQSGIPRRIRRRPVADGSHDACALAADQRSGVRRQSVVVARRAQSRLHVVAHRPCRACSTRISSPAWSRRLADIPERVAVDEWTPDGRFVIFRTMAGRFMRCR